MKQRRTPALTAECRIRFEHILYSEGWVPGSTITRIADEVGLEPDQVRDAIFAPSADKWRAEMVARNATRSNQCLT